MDNQMWFSGVTCGITTALVSTRVSREAEQLLEQLHYADEQPIHLYKQLQAKAALNNACWPAKPEISIRWSKGFDHYGFSFVEESSGATLPIDTSLG